MRSGKSEAVLILRRAFQETMGPDLIEVIERLSRRRVVAFMSANHADPDTAAEIFVMDGDSG